MRSLMFGSLLLPLLLGCGGGTCKVSGQVRFQGEPLPGGMLTFRPSNPKYNPVLVALDEQGNYEATLPTGEVQVAVDNRELRPRSNALTGLPPNLPAKARQALSNTKPPSPPPAFDKPSAPTKPRGKYVAIPEKYHTIDTSGLKFTVEPGSPKHDIELK